MRRLALGQFGAKIGLDQEMRIARIEAALSEVELASHEGSVGDLPTTLTDPNADKPLFWSDKKKEFKFLNSGTGIKVDSDDDGEGNISLDVEGGTGITVDGNTISIDLAEGPGIDIAGNTISVESNLQTINALTFAADKLIRLTGTPAADLIDFQIGTYTPTTTGNVNVDSVAVNPTMYLRIGPMAGVFGHALIDPSSGSAATEVRLSLPIASNFANSGQCVGTASSNTYGGVQIQGDPATDKAVLIFVAPSGTADDFSFVFWYQII